MRILLCAALTVVCSGQRLPFMEFLEPDRIMQMAQLASQLTKSAAESTVQNERDILSQRDRPPVRAINPDAKPSEMLGQALTNLMTTGRQGVVDALTPQKHVEKNPSPPIFPDMSTMAPAAAAAAATLPTLPTMQGQPTFPPLPTFPTFAPPQTLATPAPFNPFTVDGKQLPHNSIKPIGQRGVKTFPVPPRPPPPPPMESTFGTLPTEAPVIEQRPSIPPPTVSASSDGDAMANNPFMRLASQFLRGATGSSQPGESAAAPARQRGAATFGGESAASAASARAGFPGGRGMEPLPQIGIKDVVPGANNNFGIPKGQGCLPFLSEFMQAAYGNCVQVADEKAFDAWGSEIQSALYGGGMDLLAASKETCKRGAEREQCTELKRVISECDILASLQVAAQLQRAIKRCDEITGIIDQNPMRMMNQVGNLIGGEFAQGFINNFLSGSNKGR